MKQAYSLYKKEIDSGQGAHWLEVNASGQITKQWLAPRTGGNHYYGGNGNPSLVGKNITELRGQGFQKVRMSETQYENYLAAETLP